MSTPDLPPLPELPMGAVYTRALGTVGASMYTYTADQVRELLRTYGAACAAREPLSEEQIKRIDDSTHFHESPDWAVRFARAIERAHGID